MNLIIKKGLIYEEQNNLMFKGDVEFLINDINKLYNKFVVPKKNRNNLMQKSQAKLYMQAIDKKNLYKDSISAKLKRKTNQLMFNTFITQSMYEVLSDKKPKKNISECFV